MALTISKQQQLEIRTVMYKVMSNLYKEPNEALLANLEILAVATEQYDQSLVPIIRNMKSEVSNYTSNFDTILIDYAKLFIGPFRVLAPPYSSIYLENKWEVMGSSTKVVENYYHQAGLQITNRHEPPDHLCLQLEYLYYLNYQLANANNQDLLAFQTDFYEKIFVVWIPQFTKMLRENATTDFYRNLGLFTELFVEKEKQLLTRV